MAKYDAEQLRDRLRQARGGPAQLSPPTPLSPAPAPPTPSSPDLDEFEQWIADALAEVSQQAEKANQARRW